MCYNEKNTIYEVIFVENQQMENQEEQELEQAMAEETPKYVPRPMWQVWGARIALVLFLLVILFYYLKIARGGL